MSDSTTNWSESTRGVDDSTLSRLDPSTDEPVVTAYLLVFEGASATVTDQPHNQTFQIAIQLGLVGAALLYGVWISHLLMFRGAGLVAWLGVGMVVQNILACIFNTYLLEFTLGWIYVFGIGVLGGMMLRQRAPAQ